MNKQPIKPGITLAQIASRLYTIRNIANLAVLCPQEEAEIYILQNVIEHISALTQNLVEKIEADDLY